MNRGLLLDTHVLLWMMLDASRIPASCRQAIDHTARVCVSPISIVELCIKNSLGKLPLPLQVERDPGPAFLQAIDRLALQPLPFDIRAASRIKDLPRHHDDPFDRLLIVQALEAELTLVTHDRIMGRYEGLEILWA